MFNRKRLTRHVFLLAITVFVLTACGGNFSNEPGETQEPWLEKEKEEHREKEKPEQKEKPKEKERPKEKKPHTGPLPTEFVLKNESEKTYYLGQPDSCSPATSWVTLANYSTQPGQFPHQCTTCIQRSQRPDTPPVRSEGIKAIKPGESVRFRWSGKSFGTDCMPNTSELGPETELAADFYWYSESDLETFESSYVEQVTFEYGASEVRHVIEPNGPKEVGPQSTTFTLKNSTNETKYLKRPNDCLSADSWVSLQPYRDLPTVFPFQCEKCTRKGSTNNGISRQAKALHPGESISFHWSGKAYSHGSCKTINGQLDSGTKLPVDFAWYDEPNLEEQSFHKVRQITFKYGETDVRHVVEPSSTTQ